MNAPPSTSHLVSKLKGAHRANPQSSGLPYTAKEVGENLRDMMTREDLAFSKDNRELRKSIAIALGVSLAIEVFLLFGLVLAQGVGRIPVVWINSPYIRAVPFELQEWTFCVFTSAVLLQTFGLSTLVVGNLFPKQNSD
jgi:hypothetical protein